MGPTRDMTQRCRGVGECVEVFPEHSPLGLCLPLTNGTPVPDLPASFRSSIRPRMYKIMLLIIPISCYNFIAYLSISTEFNIKISLAQLILCLVIGNLPMV